MRLNNSSLHYYIMKHIIDKGNAPKVAEMAGVFKVATDEMITALKALQDYHGVVLHPESSEVWVMHPFSCAPTNFWIESDGGSWWGNCAWCALGAAALLDKDLTITTNLGAESRQVTIEIRAGKVMNENLFIHFPIPMIEAWDNVIYTCSTMLVFESESDIESWCERHCMEKGDVQPINKVWEFSKVWYGNHLSPNWMKWSVDEAKEIFARFNLVNLVWDMPSNNSRF
ncbi:hypothetical protein CWC22_009495 [Pseudoalteromonas rubra]|uniref:Alkylmercury lyase n=1 Tax=Pseudoalteromonas rubra TaxID=43658 RepID=A0A5S3UX80_9GAMM|nr:alkylmercury lyase family protein [Pseudoalteromonas rubra]QPB83209.1 hypothetical protein CWC22_009495 [Pseudoalteromonas rubra]